MGKALVTACLLLAACQPMYGAKPVPLRNPPPHNPPKGTGVATAEPIPYVDECNVNFTAPPLANSKRQTATSVQLTLAGDSALQTAPKAQPAVTPVAVSATQQASASPGELGRAALLEGVRRTSASPGELGRAALLEGVRRAIDKYREALVKDPYNAEATLKLALAYDRVLRKGCALALMHRLDSLARATPFDKQANPVIDLIEQNPHWFGPYHREALQAAGR